MSIQGVQGAIQEGPEPIPEVKTKQIGFLVFFLFFFGISALRNFDFRKFLFRRGTFFFSNAKINAEIKITTV